MAKKKAAIKKAPKKKPAKKAATAKKAAAEKAVVKKPAKASKKAKKAPPTAEELRTAAYLRYKERLAKGEPGDELADWLEAQRAATKGKKK